MNSKILDTIETPDDLRQLELQQLAQLATEVRSYLLDEVSKNPGHLGANLGVVELTIALHYAYNTPKDKLIWDVGHQAYIHKILTGRKKQFHTNRLYKGLSGFPRRSESPYDTFGVGHASTSISAALGMATASYLKGDTETKHIAVIGDGALTGGLAFEGLNNAGTDPNIDVLVILNDNDMAIDPNVGSLNRYFTSLATSSHYNKLKNSTWNFLDKFNKPGQYVQRLGKNAYDGFKGMLQPKEGHFFDALNFDYFGPINGHDIGLLVKTLEHLKAIKGPKLLHIVTRKGKGLKVAEKEQTTYHAPGLFDKETGERIRAKQVDTPPDLYQDVFGHTLLELAQQDEKIVGVTPAMPSGCSMNMMMKQLPERTFDVGIAEAHAVTFSAGLACEGMIPFCNIYSSFMQRAYDQVIHDVALQELKVIFCLDRAGLVGQDGATHHGAYDLAYLRAVPKIVIAAPMNAIELRQMMYTAYKIGEGPFAIRYPRGDGHIKEWRVPFELLQIGKGVLVSEGEKVAVLSLGHPGNLVQKALKELGEKRPAHYNVRFLKPLDEQLLHEIFKNYNAVLTVEDGTVHGGLWSAISEFVTKHRYNKPMQYIALPDHYIEHGSIGELQAEAGTDDKAILKAIEALWAEC